MRECVTVEGKGVNPWCGSFCHAVLSARWAARRVVRVKCSQACLRRASVAPGRQHEIWTAASHHYRAGAMRRSPVHSQQTTPCNLTARGHDAQHGLDLQMDGASDPDIWNHAVAQGRALVSKDEDGLRCLRNPSRSPLACHGVLLS